MKIAGAVGAVALTGLVSWMLYEPAPSAPHEMNPQRLLPAVRAPSPFKTGAAQKNVKIRGEGPIRYTAEGPSPIRLADVPRNAKLDTGGQTYVRGGPRIESRFTDRQIQDAQAAAAAQPASAAVLNLDGSQKPVGFKPKIGVSFDAIDVSDCCAGTGFSAFVPPDPDIIAGLNHVIVVVNTAFEVFDKQGNSLTGPIQFSTFFDPTQGGTNPGAGTPTPGCTAYADIFGDGRQFGAVFDPDVVYDEVADRFIIGIDGNGTDFCIAATTTGDPTGSWNRFGFPTNVNGAFFDFPHMGVGVDAIYMGSNQFGGSLPFGFEGRVFAMDKADLYSGTPLAVVTRELAPAGMEGPLNFKLDGTPQPAQLSGASDGTYPTSGPHYIMGEFFDGKSHAVYAWDDPFGADSFNLVGDVDLAAGSGVPCEGFSCFPIPWPQRKGIDLIDSGDFRGQETKFRNGRLWTTQNISCNPGKGVRNCVRWAQIDPTQVVPGALDPSGFPLVSGTDGVVQAGVFGSDWGYRTYGSVAANSCDDMAVGYTRADVPANSNGGSYPSIYVTGRRAADPLGVVGGERRLVKANGPYRSFQDDPTDPFPVRWGDYTGMAIDPDGKTFWYVGEYARAQTVHPSTNWGTYVGSFTLNSCN